MSSDLGDANKPQLNLTTGISGHPFDPNDINSRLKNV